MSQMEKTTPTCVATVAVGTTMYFSWYPSSPLTSRITLDQATKGHRSPDLGGRSAPEGLRSRPLDLSKGNDPRPDGSSSLGGLRRRTSDLARGTRSKSDRVECARRIKTSTFRSGQGNRIKIRRGEHDRSIKMRTFRSDEWDWL
jgi:hypothetical protein